MKTPRCTPENIAAILAGKRAGRTWPEIGAALGMPWSSAAGIWHRLPLHEREAGKPTTAASPLDPAAVPRPADPLPAGHPISWGAISAAAYPRQVAA